MRSAVFSLPIQKLPSEFLPLKFLAAMILGINQTPARFISGLIGLKHLRNQGNLSLLRGNPYSSFS